MGEVTAPPTAAPSSAAAAASSSNSNSSFSFVSRPFFVRSQELEGGRWRGGGLRERDCGGGGRGKGAGLGG